MFTLAETASGAIVLSAFGDQLSRAVPLAVRAEIGYKKLAMGPVSATAELGRPAAEVVGELHEGKRPELPVEVVITREGGAVTGEMTMVWTLRPNEWLRPTSMAERRGVAAASGAAGRAVGRVPDRDTIVALGRPHGRTGAVTRSRGATCTA